MNLRLLTMWGQSEQERWLGEEIEWLLGQFITKLTISVILVAMIRWS
jgi:hypothetical protein